MLLLVFSVCSNTSLTLASDLVVAVAVRAAGCGAVRRGSLHPDLARGAAPGRQVRRNSDGGDRDAPPPPRRRIHALLLPRAGRGRRGAAQQHGGGAARGRGQQQHAGGAAAAGSRAEGECPAAGSRTHRHEEGRGRQEKYRGRQSRG